MLAEATQKEWDDKARGPLAEHRAAKAKLPKGKAKVTITYC